MKELPKHLGGNKRRGKHFTHVDKGLLAYLYTQFNIKSFLDVGCSSGDMIRTAKELGLYSKGIDGDFTIDFKELKDDITLHDFNIGNVELNEKFDLGWCVEFLEHIEEKYLDNVFDTFKKCKYILCTASTNDKVKYHKNTKPREYWVKKFDENGFKYLHKEIKNINKFSTMQREFIRETGMLFKNTREE